VLVQLLDLGLGVWGPGWDRYLDDPEFGRSIRGGALRPSEWRKVYSAADLVLNLSYGFGGPREVYGTMANVRVFEALACGACQVVDAKRDISSLFRNGEHLVLFRSPDEARRIVLDLLPHAGRRKEIGEAGRREVLTFHTWRHRTDRIVADLMSLTRPKVAEGAR
jgi:spore maturation protein CgeB